LYVSSRCTILFTARLLYHVVFESYKPFNGQGGSRLLLLTVQRNLLKSHQIASHPLSSPAKNLLSTIFNKHFWNIFGGSRLLSVQPGGMYLPPPRSPFNELSIQAVPAHPRIQLVRIARATWRLETSTNGVKSFINHSLSHS